jgi:hypothetical protein
LNTKNPPNLQITYLCKLYVQLNPRENFRNIVNTVHWERLKKKNMFTASNLISEIRGNFPDNQYLLGVYIKMC